jgi:hypothetical protein
MYHTLASSSIIEVSASRSWLPPSSWSPWLATIRSWLVEVGLGGDLCGFDFGLFKLDLVIGLVQERLPPNMILVISLFISFLYFTTSPIMLPPSILQLTKKVANKEKLVKIYNRKIKISYKPIP